MILAFRGFQYASGDVVDVMSYAKFLQDHTLFLKDFYVTNINSIIPNERIVFSTLLAIMGNGLDWMPFLVHFILTIIFLIGIYKIISVFINSIWLRWILILVLIGPFYKFNLGGNELFYNMLISSYVAKVFAIWAVYWFIKGEKLFSYILLIFSTFLHPTVGSQLFIVFASFELLIIFKNQYSNISKNTIIGIGLYLILGGSYIFLLLKGVNKTGVDDKMFFEIFEFRNAHHFFPQYFGLKNYIIEISLFLAGIFLMYRMKYRVLFNLSLIIAFGLVIYSIGIFIFQSTLVLSTQWFKTTIWLEFFALIAVTSFIENKLNVLKKEYFNKVILSTLLILSSIFWIAIIYGVPYFQNKPYQFKYGMNLTQEEEIGLLAKQNTPKEAVFIYPLEFTGFKFYSERSIYIDFKSVVHRKDVLGNWYDRIKFIYGIDIDTRRAREDLFIKARQNYSIIDKLKIVDLKNKGIDYIVQYNNVKMELPLIAKNDEYSIYKIE